MKAQAGFSLVELVVSLFLAGLVATGAASSLFYLVRANRQFQEKLPVVNSFQTAGRWISRDVQMARQTNLVDGAQPVDLALTPVELYRTDYSAEPPTGRTTRYLLSGSELQRDDDGQITTVARGISAAAASVSGRIITLTLGSSGEERNYQIHLRAE